jgi:hypothetical protein
MLSRSKGALYAAFRTAVASVGVLGSYDPVGGRNLAIVRNRSRCRELPAATKPVSVEQVSGPRRRGSVIVPAYNEAAVIERTLAPLSLAAVDGFIELIVVCNGCSDDTADRARSVPGAQVVELKVGSKPLALNTGDEVATLWPRLYLDADIQITTDTVIAVLDRLARGDVLAARPTSRYGLVGANALVRSYYRARTRAFVHQDEMWWAGVYGLNEKGHARFGAFPDVTGDDLFVDSQFDTHEKAVVPTQPSVWTTPTNLGGLLTVLGRHYRGNTELARDDPAGVDRTSSATARAVLCTIRGLGSMVDAAVYIAIAVTSRLFVIRRKRGWERDESSRAH